MNAGVLAMLANATASINGQDVSGVFENESTVGLGLVEGTRPVFTCNATEAASLAQGDDFDITYGSTTTTYVLGSREPDGTGMVKLILELP